MPHDSPHTRKRWQKIQAAIAVTALTLHGAPAISEFADSLQDQPPPDERVVADVPLDFRDTPLNAALLAGSTVPSQASGIAYAIPPHGPVDPMPRRPFWST